MRRFVYSIFFGIVFGAAALAEPPSNVPHVQHLFADERLDDTFIGVADGSPAVMIVTAFQGAQGNMTDQRSAPLQDDALRALLVDVSVTDSRIGRLDDAPAEIFRADGTYQLNSGRGIAIEDWFEVRDGAVCVPQSGSRPDDAAPRCRRVHPNGDGTYTFVDTADGTSIVMMIAPLR